MPCEIPAVAVFATDPLGNTVEKKYDGEGNLLWVEDQNGNKTQYSYDLAGRRTEETFADGTTKTYEYDLAGRLTESTDQNGSVITSTYDAAGRLTERSVDRAAGVIGTTEQTFSYDDAGRLLSSTDNNDPADSADDATVSKSYDALGRTTAETVNGYSVQSSYTGSRRTEIEYPGGTQVDRSYDAAGNLDTVKRDGTTVADYNYDSRNQVTGATFGNGLELTNQHDELGRMTDRQYNKDGNMIAGFSYDYDEVGNKLYQEDLRDSDQSELYGYDSRDRLTDWERGELNGNKEGIVTMQADQTWDLDPMGNWDKTTHEDVTELRDHNDVNELTHRENGVTADLKYDDNGNLIEDSEYEYAYDAFNRLVGVTDKSNDKVVAEYTYDTQNRRITHDAEPENGAPVSVEYAYDGWQVVEEHEVRGGGGGKGKGKGNGQGGPPNGGGGPGGETVRTYTYGNYIDEPITMTSSGAGRSGTFYYHTNNLYNVRALTDSSGNVVERYRYSAYGEPTILDDQGNEIQSSTVGNRYMFQGRRHDAETGLYYYRNRYYSAVLGRFVTRDPMGYMDGYNLYQYGGSYPTVASDPRGLKKRKLPCCNGKTYDPKRECCEDQEVVKKEKSSLGYWCCPEKIKNDTARYQDCIEEVYMTYAHLYRGLERARDAMLNALVDWESKCRKKCRKKYWGPRRGLCEFKCASMAGATSSNIWTGYIAELAIAQTMETREYDQCKGKYNCAKW